MQFQESNVGLWHLLPLVLFCVITLHFMSVYRKISQEEEECWITFSIFFLFCFVCYLLLPCCGASFILYVLLLHIARSHRSTRRVAFTVLSSASSSSSSVCVLCLHFENETMRKIAVRHLKIKADWVNWWCCWAFYSLYSTPLHIPSFCTAGSSRRW